MGVIPHGDLQLLQEGDIIGIPRPQTLLILGWELGNSMDEAQGVGAEE